MIFAVRPVKESWSDIEQLIPSLILENKCRKICEIGAGANPFLVDEFIQENEISYTLVDIDQDELEKGHNDYVKKNINFASNNFEVEEKYDFIFSHMTLEHIKHPKIFHQNVLKSLHDGGLVVHFFATLFSVPSCINLMLPEVISKKILFLIQKRDKVQHGKFPAYYRWCLGPVSKNINRFESLGFEIISYKGYVGHTYFARGSWWGKLEALYSKFLYQLRNPYLSSNAITVFRKPSKD